MHVKPDVQAIKNSKDREAELGASDKALLRISKLNKLIKTLALERVADVYANYYEFNLSGVTEELLQITQSRVSMLSKESASKSSSLLKIFLTWLVSFPSENWH